MTDLRKAAQQALEALEGELWLMLDKPEDEQYRVKYAYLLTVITALRTALEQQQAEPVSHAVIAGALFDFMGWLTTRDERLVLSGADEAGPAVEAITAFSKMRGLSLDDAKVQDWQDYTTPPKRPWQGLTDEDIALIDWESLATKKDCARAIEAKLKERNK